MAPNAIATIAVQMPTITAGWVRILFPMVDESRMQGMRRESRACPKTSAAPGTVAPLLAFLLLRKLRGRKRARVAVENSQEVVVGGVRHAGAHALLRAWFNRRLTARGGDALDTRDLAEGAFGPDRLR